VSTRSLLALGCALAGLASSGASQVKPHIVFLFADDMGWTDVSGGSTNRGHPSDYYRTPNIDALAAAGMSFDNAYSCGPNCAPTRAALMSGQYAPRTGVYTVNSPNRGQSKFRKLEGAPNTKTLSPQIVTLAETLKNAGYATGHFGKWHLGDDSSGRGPASQGFVLNVGGTAKGSVSGGSNGHFAKSDGSFNLPNMPANQKPNQFMADRLTDEALAFMDKNKAGPFFVYVTHFSVHTPTQAPAADKNAFNNVKKGVHHKNQTYAGMLKNLDDNIGRIMSYLQATGDPQRPGKKLISNTVVVFYSDNGGVGGYADAGQPGAKEITHQYPLKSGKGSLYEGGIRVPLIVRWDGVVAPKSVTSVPVSSVDLYPTLARIAGASLPNQILDGESFEPILTGKAKALKRDALFWHFPAYLQSSSSNGTWRTTPVSVIRKGRWKLHFYYETRHYELYDVDNDLRENRDLAEQDPALVQSLSAELRAWLIRTNADTPRFKGTTKPVPYPGDFTELFGAGCRGTGGVPALTGRGLPFLGSDVELRLASLAPTANVVFVFLGGSNTVWAGGRLPLGLDGFGMPGCHLLVDPAVGVGRVVTGGRASYGFKVPNTVALAGKNLYAQGFVPDRAANKFGMTSTNGYRATIGRR